MSFRFVRLNLRRRLPALLLALFLWSTRPARADPGVTIQINPTPSPVPWLWPVVILVIAVLGFLVWRKHDEEREPPPPAEDSRFSALQITQTFLSALTSISRELKLEVASTRQIEISERTEPFHLFGVLDLGDNTARLQVPVVYRYHVSLEETWRLEVDGGTLLVHAPRLRASLPPAIDTAHLSLTATRGWGRLPPEGLREQLLRDLTGMLVATAEDPQRVALVRETARQSVAEFTRRWLEGERRWGPQGFHSIHVRFADEPVLPDVPTLKLLGSGSE